MENKEIMQRLLQDGDSSKTSVKEETIATKKDKNWEIPMSRIRVVTAKYKVYIVLLAIFIFALLISYIPNAKDSYKLSMNSYDQVKMQLNNVKRDIEDAKVDMNYLFDIVKNEKALKECLNSDRWCSSLPEWWLSTWNDSKLSSLVPLSYLQMHSLYNKKMPVDEKAVLKNLNEYLIKQDISWNDRWRVWEILRIEIWDPEYVNWWDEHFLQVPVDVEIEFTTVDDLIGFLYNVEKRLIDNTADRILYKIQAVSYDVVSKDEPQVTDISMIAYYYHDDKFNDVDENTAILESSKVDNKNVDKDSKSEEESEDLNESNDSESVFDEIFKNFKK